jgi:hypothetical protein
VLSPSEFSGGCLGPDGRTFFVNHGTTPAARTWHDGQQPGHSRATVARLASARPVTASLGGSSCAVVFCPPCSP